MDFDVNITTLMGIIIEKERKGQKNKNNMLFVYFTQSLCILAETSNPG